MTDPRQGVRWVVRRDQIRLVIRKYRPTGEWVLSAVVALPGFQEYEFQLAVNRYFSVLTRWPLVDWANTLLDRYGIATWDGTVDYD